MGLLGQMRQSANKHMSTEEHNTALLMLEAVFASVLLQITNPYYQFFATAIGADDIAISLISSLPSFCALFVLLPSSLLIDRVRDKKKFLMNIMLVCGVILPLVALSPILGDRGYWFFIIGISMWNAPYIMYTVSWQSYFSDLYPAARRALPYSRRQMVYNAVPVFTMMACGSILTFLCRTQESKILAYQIFFFMAFGASLLQRWAISRTQYPESVHHTANTGSKTSPMALAKDFLHAIRELKKHPQFCIFLALLFVFYFSWQMAWPMFFIFLIREVGYNEIEKSVMDVSGYIAQTLTSTWWGKRIDKYGPRGSTVLGMFSCALVPAWTVFAPLNFPFLLGSYIFSGATAPGFQLGLFNDMLDNCPEENKTLYIGIYNLVMQISNFVAPLFGTFLYSVIGAKATMNCSSIVRFVAATLFLIRYLVLKNNQKSLKKSA